MQEACYMRMGDVTLVSKRLDLNQSGTSLVRANGHVTHGSQCLELKRSARSLLHASGHGYTWIPVSGAETKWNKLVPMPMDTVTDFS